MPKITCKLCKGTFIGETRGTIRTRINEHTNQKFGEVYKHFLETSKEITGLELIKWKIVGEGLMSASTLIRSS